MNTELALHRGAMLIALLTGTLLCGCASSGSKQGAASDESQTAQTRQVILVPIVILSSPDADPSDGRQEVTPRSIPLDYSPGSNRLQQGGGPVRL